VASGIPLFGLPGNPVSSFVSYYQFVHPAIRRSLGFRESGRLPVVRAVVGCPLKGPPGRADYQRGRLRTEGGKLIFDAFSDQGSGNLTSIVSADGLAVIPEGVGHLDAGASVDVELLPSD
jgi:molybdopterin molybdotransferase